ncbi:MAG: hypothetical protein K5673_04265 [Lachnospiraceae bacterium]|nr:hypothetical protein [Lachnospiraceae bacterium]
MLRNKKLLTNTLITVYLAAIFVAACFCFSYLLSQGNVDMTTVMAEPTLPVIHLNMGDMDVNYLYGYMEPMETSFMRDTLTVVGSDRRIDFCIDTYGAQIEDIHYEVRSTDGSRLVENTEIHTGSPDDKGEIHGNFTIKDLITSGDEYMLIFVLNTTADRTVRYYTRLIWSEDVHIEEKLAYVYDFSDRTFDKERAGELTKYLESNSSGDNSSYMYADIHSSFKQVTWGNLSIRRLGEPRITVSELTPATGYFRVDYQVAISEESGEAICNVNEYFRIRYTTDRIYLLNWERYCSQIPDENRDIYADNQIELGLAGQDLEILESDGGNVFALADEGKLISVNIPDQKVAGIFSFYTDDLTDIRSSHRDHRIRILSVEESGDVTFVVYGYMNRGVHEGHVGAAIYSYDSSFNTYEELGFVDYNRPASILMASMDELSYIDREGHVYFMLERDVYEVDTTDGTMSRMASALYDDAYRVSESGQMLLWQIDGGVFSSTKLRLLNLSTGLSEDIKAGYGEYIMPLGFMNEDMVFGMAKSRDVVTDIDGSIVFPMYKIVIRNASGEILKSYSEDGVYVMSCTFSDGLMNMTRAEKNELTGSYDPISDDQIVSTVESAGNANKIVWVVTETLETIAQISMKDALNDEEMMHLIPREIAYEGSKELAHEENDTTEHYYVYGLRGFMGSFLEVSNAVNRAYDLAGVVMDGRGQCIWYRTGRVSRNQIMAITAPDKTDPSDSLAVCVDAMLRFEGVTTNTRVLLNQGRNVQEILTDYLSEYTVFNLTGCNLDSVLYYVNQDIPVLAVMNDQTAMLVTGFNESQIVLFDPITGELRKENITDADNTFKANGYRFLTYIY